MLTETALAAGQTSRWSHPCLCEQLRPMVWTLRVYGVFPVSFGASGCVSFRWRSPALAFSLALWLLVLVSTLHGVREQLVLLHGAADRPRPLFQTAFLTLGALVLGYMPLLPVTAWREARNVAALADHMHIIQEEYEALVGRPLQVHVRCRTLLALLLAMTLPMTVLTSVVMPDYPPWRMLPYVQLYAFLIGLAALWDGVCTALQQAADAHAAAITQALSKAVPGSTTAAVRAHRLLWLRLQTTLVFLGKGMSGTKRLFLMVMLMEWVVASFSVMSIVLTYAGLGHAFIPACIAAVAGGLLFECCDASERALTAIRCRSRKVLLRIPTVQMESDTFHEVMLMLNTIRAAATDSISVGGYVRVNRASLVTYIKLTGTYLVILGQFATSDRDQLNAEVSFGKGSGI